MFLSSIFGADQRDFLIYHHTDELGAADPDGVDPDPALAKKMDPDPTAKKTRIRHTIIQFWQNILQKKFEFRENFIQTGSGTELFNNKDPDSQTGPQILFSYIGYPFFYVYQCCPSIIFRYCIYCTGWVRSKRIFSWQMKLTKYALISDGLFSDCRSLAMYFSKYRDIF